VRSGKLKPVLARTLTTSVDISEALGEDLPIVVLSSRAKEAQVAGILPPFDLL